MDAVFDDDFWKTKNLVRPTLSCLTLDSSLYKTLLYQAKGEIDFDDSGIWLTDKTTAFKKFSAFFEQAISTGAELAITPEYSCPWEALKNLLDSEKFPTENNIWLIGMQSLNPTQLREFIDGTKDIIWIYDEELVEDKLKTQPNGFFDPVCKLVWTSDKDGVKQKIIIIQFKNYPFGGKDAEWERNNLILGRKFFVIRNKKESTRLITLICSDSLKLLNFNEIDDEMFLPLPLLIVHIQLNQKPFGDNYKLYRNLLFSKGGKDWIKEVICLNWARGVTYMDNNKTKTFNETSGSAFYLKSTKIACQDEAINSNHRNGLYYTCWKNKGAHTFYLNFDEFVFLAENTKPAQIAADPTQHNRTGPKIVRTFRWNNDAWQINKDKLPDGFIELVRQVEHKPGALDCISKSENFLEVERLVQLCSGDISDAKNWYEIDKIISLKISDDEINNRIVFTQLHDESADKLRTQKIQNYSILKHSIITNQADLPYGFTDVDLKFSPKLELPERYLLNAHSKNETLKATAVYLGSSSNSTAAETQKRISDLFEDSHQGKLVMVWHETIHGRVRYPKIIGTPSIRENVQSKSDSFTKKRDK